MPQTAQASYVARDTILQLLSDEETARISTAEGLLSLPAGTEYLDLENLEKGIQRAQSGVKMNVATVIPRDAVGEDTWKKIQGKLPH